MLNINKLARRATGPALAAALGFLSGSASCGSLATRPTCVTACNMLCDAFATDDVVPDDRPSVDAAFDGFCAEKEVVDDP